MRTAACRLALMSDPLRTSSIMDKPKPMTLDVFSEKTNAAVARMPGRQFPGVVMQGDTLSVIVYRARDVRSARGRWRRSDGRAPVAGGTRIASDAL